MHKVRIVNIVRGHLESIDSLAKRAIQEEPGGGKQESPEDAECFSTWPGEAERSRVSGKELQRACHQIAQSHTTPSAACDGTPRRTSAKQQETATRVNLSISYQG